MVAIQYGFILCQGPDKGGSGMSAMTLLLLLVTFLAVWGFPPARALAQSAHHAPLTEGAKKEGQLNWYTSMSVVDHTKYLELFKRNTRSSK
jgi:hypothetical protein